MLYAMFWGLVVMYFATGIGYGTNAELKVRRGYAVKKRKIENRANADHKKDNIHGGAKEWDADGGLQIRDTIL